MTDSSTWTPAPLEPEPPQGQPPAHPDNLDAASVDTESQAPGDAHRGGRMLAVVAGVLVLALVAVGAWMVFLRPSGGAVASEGVVADITATPDQVWSYRYAPRGDEEWISEWASIRAVGDDRFLVKADLNSATYYEQNSTQWYSGYDEHYAAGYADGQRYKTDYDFYEQDTWSNPYPDQADYFSLSGTTHGDAQYDSAYQGWFDGFSDGRNGYDEGSSRQSRPADPPTLGFVAMIDRADGEELWRVDMDVLDVEVGTSATLHPLTPEGHIVLSTGSWEGEDFVTTLVSLDPADGSVVSEHELTAFTVATGAGASTPLIAFDEDVVVRLNPEDLGGDYVWSAAVQGIQLGEGVSVHSGLVEVYTDEGSWWLDADTGYEPGWFEEPDPDVSYRVLDDVVLRLESSGFGSYIDALDTDGKVLWTGDAERVLTPDGSGGKVLLVAEDADSTGAEFLMRLDPRTGEEMWDEEYDDQFLWASGTVPGAVVLEQDDRSVVVDLGTGERLQRLRGTADYLGTAVAYGSDESRVRAWDLSDGSELWAVRISDADSLVRAGDALLIRDSARREISLLQ